MTSYSLPALYKYAQEAVQTFVDEAGDKQLQTAGPTGTAGVKNVQELDRMVPFVQNELKAGRHWGTSPDWDKQFPADKFPGRENIATTAVHNYANNLAKWRMDPPAKPAEGLAGDALAAWQKDQRMARQQAGRSEQVFYEQMRDEKNSRPEDFKRWGGFQFPRQVGDRTVMRSADEQLADVATALSAEMGDPAVAAVDQTVLNDTRAAGGLARAGETAESANDRVIPMVGPTKADVARATAIGNVPEADKAYAKKLADNVAVLREGAAQAAAGNAQSLFDWFNSSWTNWLIPAGLLVGLFGGNKMLQLAGVAAAGYGGYKLYDMYNQLNSDRGSLIASDVFKHLGTTKDAKLDPLFLSTLEEKYGQGASYIARTAAALPAVGFHAETAGMIDRKGAAAAQALNPASGLPAYQQEIAARKIPAATPGWGDWGLEKVRGMMAPTPPTAVATKPPVTTPAAVPATNPT